MIFFNKKNNKNKTFFNSGFTLIEMLVSLALFSTVMVLAVSSLFFVIEGARKTRSVSAVMSSLSYALENISRNLRVGHTYNCGSEYPLDTPVNCSTSGKDSIAFESMMGSSDDTSDQWIYKYNSSKKTIERSNDGGSTFLDMTSTNVVVEKMKFYVEGAGRSDDLQPRVVIVVKGHVNISDGTKTNFNIQTTASQRVLDF